MQLDIFEHSRDVMLRSDVVTSLEQRDAAAAQAAWVALGDEYPLDETLAPLALLIDALQRQSIANAPFADHDALRDARRVLIDETAPAALRMWGGTAATAWLAALWRQTAERAAALPFQAERSDDHAAPLWLLAGDWAAAADAVAHIESWRRIPAPLGWMAEARYRIEGLDAAWALLAELAWLSPRRFDELTKRLTDPSLHKLRKHFDATFEGDGEVADLAWFPAWVLIDKPGLAHLLSHTQPSRDDGPTASGATIDRSARSGAAGTPSELVERRRRLRDLHAGLYAAYMKTR